MAAKKTSFVKHPVIADLVVKVAAEKLDDWKAAGWKVATKADVAAAGQVDDQDGPQGA